MDGSIKGRRFFLHRAEWKTGECSDQDQGKPQPALAKAPVSEERIELPKNFESVLLHRDLFEIMKNRKSSRLFEPDPLSLQELSFLLWMTQGVKEVAGNAFPVTVRTVPSAGARHATETYLFVNRVEGLEQGCYHYLPLTHELECLKRDPDQIRNLSGAFCGQTYFAGSAVCFVWTAVPARMEWRYGPDSAKLILIDAGHISENLYLAGAAIGCGVCAVASYQQEKADSLLGLDGEEECVIFAAAVGKKEPVSETHVGNEKSSEKNF